MVNYLKVFSSISNDIDLLGKILDEGDSLILFSRNFTDDDSIEDTYIEEEQITFEVMSKDIPDLDVIKFAKNEFKMDVREKDGLHKIKFIKKERMC